MNLVEAIRSGKAFSRNEGRVRSTAHDPKQCRYYSFTSEDLLADDWEVEEPKTPIGRTEFEAATRRVVGASSVSNQSFIQAICESLYAELGL